MHVFIVSSFKSDKCCAFFVFDTEKFQIALSLIINVPERDSKYICNADRVRDGLSHTAVKSIIASSLAWREMSTILKSVHWH